MCQTVPFTVPTSNPPTFQALPRDGLATPSPAHPIDRNIVDAGGADAGWDRAESRFQGLDVVSNDSSETLAVIEDGGIAVYGRSRGPRTNSASLKIAQGLGEPSTVLRLVTPEQGLVVNGGQNGHNEVSSISHSGGPMDVPRGV